MIGECHIMSARWLVNVTLLSHKTCVTTVPNKLTIVQEVLTFAIYVILSPHMPINCSPHKYN